MELTYQEKVNLSFLFLSTYEKLNELYKNIYFKIIDDFYSGKINNTEIDEKVRKALVEKFGEKNKLKDKQKFEILVDTKLISKEENDLRYELSKLRDQIAHKPGMIYYEDMTVGKFKIKEMIKLFQNLVAKVCGFILFSACRTDAQRNAILKQIYLIPIAGIQMMAEELLPNEKFNEIHKLFKEKIIIKNVFN